MRDFSETTRARRYVARCAAAILSRDGENAWLYQDEDVPEVEVGESVVRRRKKALQRLVASLHRAGERGEK